MLNTAQKMTNFLVAALEQSPDQHEGSPLWTQDSWGTMVTLADS